MQKTKYNMINLEENYDGSDEKFEKVFNEYAEIIPKLNELGFIADKYLTDSRNWPMFSKVVHSKNGKYKHTFMLLFPNLFEGLDEYSYFLGYKVNENVPKILKKMEPVELEEINEKGFEHLFSALEELES